MRRFIYFQYQFKKSRLKNLYKSIVILKKKREINIINKIKIRFSAFSACNYLIAHKKYPVRNENQTIFFVFCPFSVKSL